jgi:Mlc titration factor MtfA (ptsG expression regulator)
MIWPLGRRRLLAVDADSIERLTPTQPWLKRLSAPERQRLSELMAEFLTLKTLTAVQGLELTDEIRLAIAAQACLPVLHLSLAHYGTFNEVVLHPSAFEVRRTLTDELGLVTEFDDVLSGETLDGGPVVLAWDEAAGINPYEPAEPGALGNVVIHEFAHKLDLADGEANGCPPMASALAQRWHPALQAAFEAFCDQLDAIEAAIPPDVDPESEAADRWYADLPLDPYAATDPAEFFAVACEAFFTDDGRFAHAFADLHACFVAYFRQEPHTLRPL